MELGACEILCVAQGGIGFQQPGGRHIKAVMFMASQSVMFTILFVTCTISFESLYFAPCELTFDYDVIDRRC